MYLCLQITGCPLPTSWEPVWPWPVCCKLAKRLNNLFSASKRLQKGIAKRTKKCSLFWRKLSIEKDNYHQKLTAMNNKNIILKRMSVENCAALRFPDPKGWNPSDKEDAAWREAKAEIQRKAYIQGRIDEKNLQQTL